MPFSHTENTVARIITAALHPFLIPIYAMAYLLFSPGLLSSALPYSSKWLLMAMIAVFTSIIPIIMVMILRWFKLLTTISSDKRMEKSYAFLITLISYFFAYKMMMKLGLSSAMTILILGGMLIILGLLIINLFWEISAYGTGFGALIGTVFILFHIGISTDWVFLLPSILIGGIGATALLILQKNKPSHIVGGMAFGFLIITGVFLLFSEMV